MRRKDSGRPDMQWVRGGNAGREAVLEQFGETKAQGAGKAGVAQGAPRPEQSKDGAELIRSSA